MEAFLEKPLEQAIFIRPYRGCRDSTEIAQIVISGPGTHVFCFLFLVVVLLQLSQFSPIALPFPPSPLRPLSQSVPTQLPMSVGHLHMFFNQTLSLLSSLIPLPTPLWSLSVCSSFPCLWFYFASLFVLFIRFLLQVRSVSYTHLTLPTTGINDPWTRTTGWGWTVGVGVWGWAGWGEQWGKIGTTVIK